MGKKCIVTGKTTVTGYNVSHSKRQTKRKVRPNLHKRKLLNPATGRMKTVTISTSGLKTLKKWTREGKSYDLRELEKYCI